MRIAFVVPWRETERWVWNYLPEKGPEADLLSAAPLPGTFWNWVRLPPYLSEFWQLVLCHSHLEKYDVVFAWELRTTLAVALLRKLRPANRRARLVAVGPILKGPLLKALPLVRWLLKDAAYIVCFSRAECETQANALNLPRERFCFVPTFWEAEESNIPLSDSGDYILAVGHSSRDYPTLLEAIQGTGLPLIICAREPGDFGGCPVPSNVSVRFRTESDETNALVARAAFHVLPLRDTNYSAGQSVLLRAMAAGKAVIVSDTAGIRDYVTNGETALLVPPGDAEALRNALLTLWDDTETQKRIGERAAESVRTEFSPALFAARMQKIADSLMA